MPLDLTGQTTELGLAGQFGYGQPYAQYFSPIREGLLGSATQAGWSGYRGAKAGEIGKTFGLKSQSLLRGGRSSLLDLTRKRQTSGGGFAGFGAAQREYGRGRSELMGGLLGGMSALRTQRGASMFGLEQDILSRIGQAQNRIEDWRQGQIGIGLRLGEMGAKKDFEGADIPKIPPIQPGSPTDITGGETGGGAGLSPGGTTGGYWNQGMGMAVQQVMTQNPGWTPEQAYAYIQSLMGGGNP